MHVMGQLIFLAVIVIVILWIVYRPAPGISSRLSQRVDTLSRGRNTRWIEQSAAARLATRRARYKGGPAYVNVTDLGLLVYRDDYNPRLVRQGAISLDTLYLRPFAELWLPHQARGTVRFEIRDGEGRLRYADEARYDLEGGRNTLLPGTWLPLRNKPQLFDVWEYRLLAADMVLAIHRFGWQPVDVGLQALVDSDGEISPELQAALQARAIKTMSLSELLADSKD